MILQTTHLGSTELNRFSFFNQLPQVLQQSIAILLTDYEDLLNPVAYKMLLNLAQTSKTYQKLVNADAVWKPLLDKALKAYGFELIAGVDYTTGFENNCKELLFLLLTTGMRKITTTIDFSRLRNDPGKKRLEALPDEKRHNPIIAQLLAEWYFDDTQADQLTLTYLALASRCIKNSLFLTFLKKWQMLDAAYHHFKPLLIDITADGRKEGIIWFHSKEAILPTPRAIIDTLLTENESTAFIEFYEKLGIEVLTPFLVLATYYNLSAARAIVPLLLVQSEYKGVLKMGSTPLITIIITRHGNKLAERMTLAEIDRFSRLADGPSPSYGTRFSEFHLMKRSALYRLGQLTPELIEQFFKYNQTITNAWATSNLIRNPEVDSAIQNTVAGMPLLDKAIFPEVIAVPALLIQSLATIACHRGMSIKLLNYYWPQIKAGNLTLEELLWFSPNKQQLLGTHPAWFIQWTKEDFRRFSTKSTHDDNIALLVSLYGMPQRYHKVLPKVTAISYDQFITLLSSIEVLRTISRYSDSVKANILYERLGLAKLKQCATLIIKDTSVLALLCQINEEMLLNELLEQANNDPKQLHKLLTGIPSKAAPSQNNPIMENRPLEKEKVSEDEDEELAQAIALSLESALKPK